MSLAVLCNANADVGYGHFFRCLYLVNEWQRITNQSVRWYGDIDDALHEHCSVIINVPWQDAISHVNAISPGTLLCDSYMLDDNVVDTLAQHHKVVVIDDFGDHLFPAAEVVINFTVAGAQYPYKSQRRLIGPDYFLCDPSLDAIRNRNLFEKERIEVHQNAMWQNKRLDVESARFLIAMGGFDRHQVGGHLAIQLGNSLPQSKVILLGKYNDELVSSLPKNVEHIPYTDSMNELFKCVNIVISGGGLVKYESAYCGILNVVLAQTDKQMQETQQFKTLGLCEPYGMARNLLSASNESGSEDGNTSNADKDEEINHFVSWLRNVDVDDLLFELKRSSLNVFSAKSSHSTATCLLNILGEEF